MEKECSVLVVEDEKSIRESLQLILEYEGYRVQGAGNGREALDLLPKIQKPCLILMDLMMPVMNGWELAQVLATDGVFGAIPLIVVSAFSEKAQGIQYKEVLKKPIDLELLLSIVRRYCIGAS